MHPWDPSEPTHQVPREIVVYGARLAAALAHLVKPRYEPLDTVYWAGAGGHMTELDRQVWGRLDSRVMKIECPGVGFVDYTTPAAPTLVDGFDSYETANLIRRIGGTRDLVVVGYPAGDRAAVFHVVDFNRESISRELERFKPLAEWRVSRNARSCGAELAWSILSRTWQGSSDRFVAGPRGVPLPFSRELHVAS